MSEHTLPDEETILDLTDELDVGTAEPSVRVPASILPWLLRTSGLYRHAGTPVRQPFEPLPVEPTPRLPLPTPTPTPSPSPQPAPLGPVTHDIDEADLGAIAPWWPSTEDVRLDVDGRHPLRTISGTLRRGRAVQVHWVARLVGAGTRWTGTIWHKHGATASFPFTNVAVTVTRSVHRSQRTVRVVFSGGGATRTRTYRWVSSSFDDVHLEYDAVTGVTPVTSVRTHDHPHRPPALAPETVSINRVLERAGFDVASTSGGTVPLAGAGSNARWSDAELHDAMQTYWSRFTDAPQWAMWVLFASLHDRGESLGGVMFDDIGPNHRQGTAVFTDSFIATAPAGRPEPDAWVRRMRFWTAVHEIGHGFNLAHAWQKSLVSQGRGPWIPLADDPDARSFMNYPFRVPGGDQAFFETFEYRFTDDELLFLRHAPREFVRMGDNVWFADHGLDGRSLDALAGDDTGLRLQLSTGGHSPVHRFLEPATVELTLTAERPTRVPTTLDASEDLVVLVTPDGGVTRRYLPYVRRLVRDEDELLQPGEVRRTTLPLFAGIGGWLVSEPGNYTVRAMLRHDGRDVVSPPLRLRVAGPGDHDQEELAAEVFTDDVGRVLALGGSRLLDGANDTLRRASEQLDDHPLGVHAAVALARPVADGFKVFDIPGGRGAMQAVHDVGGRVRTRRARPAEARDLLLDALLERPTLAAATLGVDHFAAAAADLAGLVDGDEGDRDDVLDSAEAALVELDQPAAAVACVRGAAVRRDG